MTPDVKELRAYLADNPAGTLLRLYRAFPEANLRVLEKRLTYLARQGELDYREDYVYQPKLDARRKAVQDRIWRALRVQGKGRPPMVDMDELTALSDVSEDYAARYLQFLIGRGYVGRRSDGRLVIMPQTLNEAQTPYCFERPRKGV